MKNRILVFILLAVPAIGFTQSQFLESEQELYNLSEKTAKAFYDLKPGRTLSELKLYAYDPYDKFYLNSSYTLLFEKPMYGYKGSQSYFKSSDQNIGEIAKRIVYIMQFERKISKLTFVYFKVEKGWYLDSLNFSDDYQSEFK